MTFFKQWWDSLIPYDKQVIMLAAAKGHPKGFSNAEQVGMNWYQVATKQSFEALPPYVRNFVAKRFLDEVEKVVKVHVE